MKKAALGRGLSALIPTTTNVVATDDPSTRPGKAWLMLKLDEVVPNNDQPRKYFEEEKLEQLAESIGQKGMLQPILVRKSDGKYQIVAGERRFRAAEKIGMEQVPAIDLGSLGDREVLEVSIIENLQRDDLNPLELAQGYNRLLTEFGSTQAELAERIGKDRSSIANTLRLLQLPDEIKDKIAQGRLREGHARAILALQSEKEQLLLARRILEEDLSVRAIEEIIYGPTKRRRGKSLKVRSRPIEIAAAENALKQKLGTAVSIQRGLKRGKISIRFYGDDDLTRILELLGVVI
jgi:ParB family transcriptional regulator, chromosome partitioning protein